MQPFRVAKQTIEIDTERMGRELGIAARTYAPKGVGGIGVNAKLLRGCKHALSVILEKQAASQHAVRLSYQTQSTWSQEATMNNPTISTDRSEAFVQTLTACMTTLARTLASYVQAEPRPFHDL